MEKINTLFDKRYVVPSHNGSVALPALIPALSVEKQSKHDVEAELWNRTSAWQLVFISIDFIMGGLRLRSVRILMDQTLAWIATGELYANYIFQKCSKRVVKRYPADLVQLHMSCLFGF